MAERPFNGPLFLLLLGLGAGIAVSQDQAGGRLDLVLRSQEETAPRSGRFRTIRKQVRWNAEQTAIVVCDMWDDHYCRAAARRVAEMAPRMNEVIGAARARGALIIHSPSGCMDQYGDTPQRRLAQQAPPVETPVPLQAWCHRDPQREPPLPVDVNQPCDDENPRQAVRFFTRQIDALKIMPEDAITDSKEAFYLMRQKGFRNVIVMGVHANMCVLGRPFGIRQMVYQGQNVVLMRDMTDAMYNPAEAPHVNHFTGNDLVIRHIERYWCPTVTSADIVGGSPFRFPNDDRRRMVVLLGNGESGAQDALADFCIGLMGGAFRVTIVHADAQSPNHVSGVDALDDADLCLMFVSRCVLPAEQLDAMQRYAASDRPLIAVGASSSAFRHGDDRTAAGRSSWEDFDRQVLGCRSRGVYPSEARVTVFSDPPNSPLRAQGKLGDVPCRVHSALERVRPLDPEAEIVLWGRAEGFANAEPVAWTFVRPGGGRVFSTTLGHERDLERPVFVRLLTWGIGWASGTPTPADASPNKRGHQQIPQGEQKGSQQGASGDGKRRNESRGPLKDQRVKR